MFTKSTNRRRNVGMDITCEPCIHHINENNLIAMSDENEIGNLEKDKSNVTIVDEYMPVSITDDTNSIYNSNKDLSATINDVKLHNSKRA